MNSNPESIEEIKNMAISGVSKTISKIVDATYQKAIQDTIVVELTTANNALASRVLELENFIYSNGLVPPKEAITPTVSNLEGGVVGQDPHANGIPHNAMTTQAVCAEQGRELDPKEVEMLFGGFSMTDEQEFAIDLSGRGDDLSIEAFAGSGKTTLLNAIARLVMKGKRVLYIAYNKAIQIEASKKFPSNTKCKTSHALAFRDVMGGLGFDSQRVTNYINGSSIKDKLTIPTTEALTDTSLCNYALDIVGNFCSSSDKTITRKHRRSPILEGLKNKDLLDDIQTKGIELAKVIWSKISDKESDFPICHNHYFKIWTLSNPNLNFYDTILIDEAQDSDDALITTMQNQQRPQLIWVGDKYQAIYGWRGAVNAFDKIRVDNHCTISQSFRFGSSVADLASKLLSKAYNKTITINGFDKIETKLGEIEHPDAVISRTNATLVSRAIEYINANPHKKIGIIGGSKSLIAMLKGTSKLMKGVKTNVSELAIFNTWDDVVEYSNTSEGQSLKTLVNLTKEHNVDELAKTLSGANIVDRIEDADIVFTTAHKSKGKEWNSVQLADDFRSINKTTKKEEVNLLYVAMTRGMRQLDFTQCKALQEAA